MNSLPFKMDKLVCDWTNKSSESKKITYPRHNDVITFDIDKSLTLAGVDHEYDQPCHLNIKGDPKEYANISTKIYDKPEERFCPARVFEFSNGELKFKAQNCLHCKACTIKVFKVNIYSHKEGIEWTCTEGNGGPN